MSELSPALNNEVIRPANEAKVPPVTPSQAARPRASGSTVLAVISLLVALGSAVLVGWFFYIWQPQLAALQQQQQTLSNQQQTQTTLFQSKQLELQQEMQQQLVDVVANWDSAVSPPEVMRIDAASGDSDLGDGKVGTFDPLYPRNGVYGEASLTTLSNIIVVGPTFGFSPWRTSRMS